ncbi:MULTISPECIES: DUF1853 family protein [unclassified Oceanobacter]|uniref:DUF1853 family protein n=1 Tax=unclassified Oceanobacter TaxID=2620260 RepID=UPI002735D956|nr:MULTISPECIES: DUF1853 family protein [unclassified Oceanobacter]MDP2607544.1 DUF1853 family protein [Oceanobacter sp. 1_MG-2023]MDP2610812.1 DUF1853 family protein [Oceanobacter sp. 2_MG-2023]
MQISEDAFFQLPDKHIRDLIWALTSPSLLACPWPPSQPPWLESLCQQAGCPTQWHHTSRSEQSRLGLVFESLWHEWLRHSGWRWDANIQIAGRDRTLGELDLLIDNGQQQWHLELALKFYLGIGNDWIGANRRDRLANKLRHTYEQQLPLARHPQAQPLLATRGWFPRRSEAVFRGCLFYPANPAITAQRPAEVNPHHWQGRWCHASELQEHIRTGHWVILARDEWLSPVLSPVAASAADIVQLLQCHFRYLDIPLCLARVRPLQPYWAEQQRWMIVADHWPNGRT